MQIILDDKVVEKLEPESLPMLIHGQEGSGASMYTIALAAKWYQLGYKILFLCGYEMAEMEFTNLVGNHQEARFFMKDRQKDFLDSLSGVDDKTIVVVKNFELFNQEVLNEIKTSLYIVSGDISKANLQQKNFATEVYFSEIGNRTVPQLKKYEGYVVSGVYTGTTRIEK
jgi:hypothetical protein